MNPIRLLNTHCHIDHILGNNFVAKKWDLKLEIHELELPLLLAGKSASSSRKKALEVLDMVEVGDQANKRPSEMSGGQQQRITIARALVNDPAIVWADEPTGALDSETGGLIMDLLCKLNKEREQTFVLVTHDQTVGSRAERLIFMRDGKIESDEVRSKASLIN